MRQVVFAVFCFVAQFSFAQTLIDSRQREIVIQNVNVVDMESQKILPEQTVIVKDGKIKSISRKVSYGKDALIVDGKGKYLIPGLAEMHAHIHPSDNMDAIKDALFLFAANGITTIRGMLGHPKHLEVREKLKTGELVGPRLFTTGPSMNGFSVTSPEAGAEMVRKQKEAGYDYLKLHPGLTKQKFDAVASTAKQVGIPFAGHVSFGVGVWHAIASGYSSIDHLDGFIEGLVPGIEKMTEQEAGLFGMFVADKADVTQIPKLMSALKANNVWVVPTQSLAERWFLPSYDAESFRNDPDAKYMKKETVEQWIQSKKNLQSNPQYDPARIENFVKLRRELILQCQRNGVGLLLGCDAPQVFNVPGFSTHHELAYLTVAGLTPYEALKTGTVNVARYLNMPDAGIIKAGAVADLVLIGGNPLTDISQTRKIEGVMLDGRWLSKSEIENLLAKLVKP